MLGDAARTKPKKNGITANAVRCNVTATLPCAERQNGK
jgi:hypothetical protein